MNLQETEFYDLKVGGFWNNQPYLKLLTENGIEKTDLPMFPHIYVKQSDVDPISLRQFENASKLQYREVDDFQKGPMYKIEMHNPADVKDMREFLHDRGIETYLSDMPYIKQLLIQEDLAVSSPENIMAFDIEVAVTDGVPDPEQANERILTICGMSDTGEEHVFAHDDERETIEQFLDMAAKYKAVIGWNSLTFDMPYLEKRCEKLGISYDTFSFVHIDALPIYRDVLMVSQNNYKLENVAEQEFGDYYQFADVDYAELLTYFEEDRDRLIQYNMEDVRAVKELNDRYHLKNIMFEVLAGGSYCRPDDIFYVKETSGYKQIKKSATALVEGIILNESVKGEELVIWPDKPNNPDRTRFRGAKVLEPKAGMYDDAVLLDFSSMYPAIIEALNIGPETYRPDGSGDINAPIGSFVSEPESIFSRAYRRAQRVRQTWKDRKKNAERGSQDWYVASAYDTGLKARVNCFTPDHQVITAEGVKDIIQLRPGEEVYSVNPDTLELELKQVTDMYFGWHNGMMIEQDSFKVTPNHRFLTGRSEFRQAHELTEGRHEIPKHKPKAGHTPEYVDLTDFVEEGHIMIGFPFSMKAFDLDFPYEHYGTREGDEYHAYAKMSLEEYREHQETVNSYNCTVYWQYEPNFIKVPVRFKSEQYLKLLGWIAGAGWHQGDRPYTLNINSKSGLLEQDLTDMEIEYNTTRDGVRINGAFGKLFRNSDIPDFVYNFDNSDLAILLGRLVIAADELTEVQDDITRLTLHTGNVPTLTDDMLTFESKAVENPSVEPYDGRIICPTVEDNHTIFAGRDGNFILTGQTFYGVIGSVYSRFYNKDVAENITQTGAAMITQVRDISEAEGHTVLYGDTDSVILKLDSVDDPVEAGKEFAEYLTNEIKAWMEETYNADSTLIELTLDEVYERFFITDKKKRYAGIVVWAGNECRRFEATGFESVRGDWPVASQEFQNDLLKRMLEGEDTSEIVEDYKSRLYAGELNDKLTKTVELSKPISSYKSKPPHVRVAEHYPDLHAGDEVTYLKYGKKPTDVIRADNQEFSDYLTQKAYSYLWEKNFASLADRLGVDMGEGDQSGLSDFC